MPKTHGPKNLPTAKQICSGEKLPESAPLGSPGYIGPHSLGPAANCLFHRSPSIHFQGIPQTGPGEHTETPGATPRKVYRILKNRPQVNEKPPVDPVDRGKLPPAPRNPPGTRTKCQATASKPAEKLGRRESCIRAQPQKPLRDLVRESLVSGHEFTHAATGARRTGL